MCVEASVGVAVIRFGVFLVLLLESVLVELECAEADERKREVEEGRLLTPHMCESWCVLGVGGQREGRCRVERTSLNEIVLLFVDPVEVSA